jgi:flagellin
MRINNNIMALNAHRQLGANQMNAAKSMEKLSSGFRINRAGDDAAGLAISEKMRGQIRGLTQASRNAQDGISLIQTAEGALNETHAILQRMRELAVQSSTDTNTAPDRAEIQKEIDQLAAEITRIADTTEFNTQTLMDGKFAAKFHIGANQGQNVDLAINSMDAESLKVHGEVYNTEEDFDGDFDGVTMFSRTGEKVTIEMASETDGDNDAVSKTTAKVTGDGATGWTITVTLAQAEGSEDDAGDITATHQDVLKALQGVGGEAGVYFEVDDETFDPTVKVTASTLPAITVDNWVKDEEATTTGINVSSQKSADAAISTINYALETVSAERSKLGAMQNRLEHTINNLGTSAENLQAAESRIRDLDMAEEIMAFTRNNILQQAATAMLAQANMAPQSVLQLLG